MCLPPGEEGLFRDCKNSIFAKVTLKFYSQDSQTSIIGALKHFENSVDMIRMSSVSPSFCEQVTQLIDMPDLNLKM